MENILSPYQNIAQIYDAIRPEYPNELLDDIIRETNICPGQRILELGAGTGKATKAFLDRGICVDAVELEKNMAQILRQKSNSDALRIYVSSFEDWDSKVRYPLVVSAQAFHWFDPKTKFSKCHNLLTTDGFLVLLWYDPMPSENTERDIALDAIKTEYLGVVSSAQNALPQNREQEIHSTPFFDLVHSKYLEVELRNSALQYLLAMKSTPAFMEKFDLLPAERQHAFIHDITEVIEKHGGYVTSKMRFSLFILKAVHSVTARCVLSHLCENDIPEARRLLTEPRVREYLGGPVPEDVAAHRVKGWINAPDSIHYAVRSKETNTLMGIIDISPHHNLIDKEISYQFLPEYWGKGYAYEVLNWLLAHCKNNLHVETVVSETQSANARSCNLLKQLGYEEKERLIRFGAEQIVYTKQL